MLLVAGGQRDPNIGALLRRILSRGVDFVDLLVGPELVPRASFDLELAKIRLNGREVMPSGCFIRHDVFGQQAENPVSPTSALGWYYAVRGWALSHDQVKSFNRHSLSGDGSKLQNLVAARRAGFEVPSTLVTNEPDDLLGQHFTWIMKPVGGGEYTVDFDPAATVGALGHPTIFQHKMNRPEVRAYRIGDDLFGFTIDSDDVDYRTSKNVEIGETSLDGIASRFMTFCDQLGLDFAAADFMRHPVTNDLTFLEINTQPMFVAFDRLVGGRMCDAIIDTLSA